MCRRGSTNPLVPDLYPRKMHLVHLESSFVRPAVAELENGVGSLLIIELKTFLFGKSTSITIINRLKGNITILMKNDEEIIGIGITVFARLLSERRGVTRTRAGFSPGWRNKGLAEGGENEKWFTVLNFQVSINFIYKICVSLLHSPHVLSFALDFIRLLQDLVHFKDVAQIYSTRTSSRYSLLRINPDMETQLRFLLTSIKLGHQKRHQVWFAKKFLNEPDKEFVIIDIVRFICCAHHPPNEIIQSDIVPRWALIGWLLTSCRRNDVVANVKLALFYDWLFFDERVDIIMNIEPAVLLMVHSIPKYVDITHALLEFLLHLVDSYDVERKSVLVKGVSSAFQLLVRKGVIRSLDVLISCHALHPALKERLKRLLACGKLESS
ncbi:uncharacterized protein HKW66_Vig0256590 [Vigna angularis]|uniref:Integrator complex subunit 3 N-terminal domain-containing protein n=1 Tax=Phaseolus angularis TaxID=3914 RepID=A0A8T0JT83_PHAAN|nr:uncharacterized protein HKW66_Vig0256590 [Vigna angularis]